MGMNLLCQKVWRSPAFVVLYGLNRCTAASSTDGAAAYTTFIYRLGDFGHHLQIDSDIVSSAMNSHRVPIVSSGS